MKQPISTEDNLDKELKTIIDSALHQCTTRALRSAEVQLGHVSMAKQMLRQKLTIYIVNRDGKVLEHGIKVGRDQVNGKK